MKVLVTGSSGQLGSYVCELLLDKHDVSGIDNKPATYDSVKALTRMGDIRRMSDVESVVADVDVVVHCAAQVSVERSTEDPVADAETNVLGTINLLHAASKAGVSRFIHISSAAVYGDPLRTPIDESHSTEPMSNYGASKLSGEKFSLAFAHTTSMESVVIRPFNFYSGRADPKSPYSGVITKFVARVRAGDPPVIEGDGTQTRDFIHARDVARMIEMALTKKGMSGLVLNCGSGLSTSIADLANVAIAASGRPDLKPEFVAPRKGDIKHSLADTRLAQEKLGFGPKVSMKDGIAELLS
ncbi:MAG: GDP-mannose 4,6-dehydratase [Thermoplasmata archaeon]|nr:GDP-mannose 4,6-dehydratase [Thermoplasmata archaeon]